MPITNLEYPVLSQFLSLASRRMQSHTEAEQQSPGQPLADKQNGTNPQNNPPKKLPKGVVLGKDGKPCRSCTSVASWMAMAKGANPKPRSALPDQIASAALQLPEGCPPDVEQLGRSTWTLLHTMTATYPETPSVAVQQQTKSFISLFSNMYPCSHCAEDFQQWMKVDGNAPRLSSRDEFGRWMCEAHNAVNIKLGKEKFDCSKWDERWITGPQDGRCG